MAGGLIAGAYDTPKNSSAGKTPSRTPGGTSKTPSRTPGTGLPPSRRASSSAASTPAVSISASSSAANTPAAGGGAQQQPKTPKFTPSHNTSTPIASIKRPRASLGGCRSTSKTMVHQGAGGKQRVGKSVHIFKFFFHLFMEGWSCYVCVPVRMMSLSRSMWQHVALKRMRSDCASGMLVAVVSSDGSWEQTVA